MNEEEQPQLPNIPAMLFPNITSEVKANLTKEYPYAFADIPLTPPRDFAEFQDQVGLLVMALMNKAVAPGAQARIYDATSKGMDIIAKDRAKRGETIRHAYHDAQNGRWGALREVICDSIRQETEQNYERFVRDRLVPPTDPATQELFVAQTYAQFGSLFGPHADPRNVSRVAARYDELIDLIKKAQSDAAKVFRRIG